jgi:hypothetical protein
VNFENTLVKSEGKSMWLKIKQLVLTVFLLNSVASANDISQLDGDWYSFKWKYGYSLSNGKGVAFATNSPNFKVGQEIVRLTAVDGNSFVGENVYKDGNFYKVKATLNSDGKLLFEGEKNVKWEMEKIDPETYSSIVNTKLEKQPGNFSLGNDECIILVASTQSDTEAIEIRKQYPGSALYTSKSGYIAVGLEKISKQQSAARIKELLSAGKIPKGSNCADSARITGFLDVGNTPVQNPKAELADPSSTKEQSQEPRSIEQLANVPNTNSENGGSSASKSDASAADDQTHQEQASKGGMGSFSTYHWIILIVLIGIGVGIFMIIKKMFAGSSRTSKGMSVGIFLFIYLFFMLPTYVWRWIFAAGAVGVAISDNGGSVDAINSMATATYVLLAISYVVMTFVAYRRGVANNRKFLLAFPLVGGIFDIGLGFIPFVPTIFNILAIVFGSMSRAREEDSSRE